MAHGLLKRVYNRFVREHLPRKIGVVDGRPIFWPKLFDMNYDMSDTEVESRTLLKECVREGDNVLIIGGGFGITPVFAGEMVGIEGSVTVFEASKQISRNIKRTLQINRLSDRVRVRNLIVGRANKVYGSGSRSDMGGVIYPHKLPECDVLEMDIEGVELDVLRNMNIRPRDIVVECHKKYRVFENHMADWAMKNGYRIKQSMAKDDEVYNLWLSANEE